MDVMPDRGHTGQIPGGIRSSYVLPAGRASVRSLAQPFAAQLRMRSPAAPGDSAGAMPSFHRRRCRLSQRDLRPAVSSPMAGTCSG
jgi:hypothetical protein